MFLYVSLVVEREQDTPLEILQEQQKSIEEPQPQKETEEKETAAGIAASTAKKWKEELQRVGRSAIQLSNRPCSLFLSFCCCSNFLSFF